MTSEEQKIIDIKVKYEDAIYGIIRFQEKLTDLKKTQAQMDEQLKKGEISWNEWATQTEAATAATKQYKENIRVLRKEMQNNLKTEQEQEGSLKQLRAQLSNATKAFDELSKKEREGAKGRELANHINAITQELKQAEEETQRFYRNVGNYYNSVFDAMSDVKNTLGEFEMIDNFAGQYIEGVAQMGAVTQNFGVKVKALGKTLLGLMTNPVFLALAGVTGVGMAFKWWYDYNKGIMEATRLTREFTRLSGDELIAVRNSIIATADIMGADFKDTLATVDFLMAQFGMTAQEALQVVQDGFAAGADLNGDMLSKLQRYSPAFKDMGLSAKELAAILAQTRSGIFTDQGMDAIVMAGKKLREMSDTTRKALDAAGISSKQLEEDLASGAINGFEAIQRVSMALAKTGANTKETGQVMKEVFGRQAVNAGQELLKSLATMSTSIDEIKEQTGEWGKQQQELIDKQTELKNVTSALFDVTDKGFEEMITQAKIYATQSLSEMVRWLIKATNQFRELNNESTLFRGTIELIAWAFKSLWAVCQWVFGLISNSLKGIGKDARSFLKIMEGIITFDFSKAKEGFSDLISGWGKTFTSQVGTFKKFGADMWKNTRDGWNNSVNGNELKPIEIPEMGVYGGTSAQSGTTTQPPSKTQPQGKETAKSSAKATVDEEKRAAEERKRQEQELQAAILKVQMNYQIKMMQAKKMYLADLYESDEAYQKDMSQLQQEEVARMLDVYIQAGVIGEQKALEMQQKLLDMQIQFKAQLEQEAAKMAETWRKEFEAEEQERERQLIDQGVLEEQDNEKRLERYKAFLEGKKKAYQDNAMALAEIDKESKDTEEEREKESYEKKKKLLEENKNNAVDIANQITSGFTSAFAEMFSEGEVSFRNFMRSILITTLDAIEKALLAYQAEILAREIASKSWAGVASAAALSALIAASFEGAKVAVKSFAVGGYVSGEGTGTSDSIPARLSNGESVMTARATSMFSPLLSTFNQLGGGVPIMAPATGTQMGEDFLAAAIAKGFMMCPRPVVSVEEITKLQERVKVIEGRGTM